MKHLDCCISYYLLYRPTAVRSGGWAGGQGVIACGANCVDEVPHAAACVDDFGACDAVANNGAGADAE